MAEPQKEDNRQSVTMFASGAGDSTVKIWKVDDSQADEQQLKRGEKEGPEFQLAHTLTGHSEKVTCLSFDHTKEFLASGSADKSVLIWKAATGSLHATMDDLKESPLCLSFDPSGEMLAVGGWDNMIQLRKVECGSVISTLKGHTHAVTALAFSPDGATMASASRDGTVRLWKVGLNEISSEPAALLERHSGVVTCISFSHDGSLLASGGHDTRVLVWETAALSGMQPRDANSSSGIGSSLPNCHSLTKHTEYVLAVAFPCGQGRVLASASADKRIVLWSTETYEDITTCVGHTGPVNSISFSSDSSLLVSGSRDRTLRVWAIASREVDGAELWSSEPVALIEPKPDGHSMNIEAVAVAMEELPQDDVQEAVGDEDEEDFEGAEVEAQAEVNAAAAEQ